LRRTQKKDSATTFDYGARIYDARIGRPMSVDPKSSQNNPCNFTEQKKIFDTTTVKQPADNPKRK